MAISKKAVIILSLTIAIAAVTLSLLYFNLPVHKAAIKSQLVMLGDFNNDHRWDEADAAILHKILLNPFSFSALDLKKADVNRNDLIDEEDVALLTHLFRYHDPYEAEKKAFEAGKSFPRPRELFKYIPSTEYVRQPLFIIKHRIIAGSPLTFLAAINAPDNRVGYRDQLLAEIYNEGLRFSLAYNERKNTLNEIEKKYASEKIEHCNKLCRERDYYNLLLNYP